MCEKDLPPQKKKIKKENSTYRHAFDGMKPYTNKTLFFIGICVHKYAHKFIMKVPVNSFNWQSKLRLCQHFQANNSYNVISKGGPFCFVHSTLYSQTRLSIKSDKYSSCNCFKVTDTLSQMKHFIRIRSIRCACSIRP